MPIARSTVLPKVAVSKHGLNNIGFIVLKIGFMNVWNYMEKKSI